MRKISLFTMLPKRLAKRLAKRLRSFHRADDGNVATLFALTVIPIIGFTGAAIDYSRASSVKAAMQGALDATALAMAKEATTVSSSQLQTDAAAYFAAAFNRRDAQNIQINASYSTSGSATVTVSGTGSIKTDFLGIMGINNIPISSSSQTTWGMSRLRVALVLDNTGSMAMSSKMTALQSASKALLTQLQNAASSPGDVYVSIIPFSKDVNVGGPTNYNATWIDWSDWNDDNGVDTKVQTCTTSVKKSGKSSKKCANTTTWVPANHSTWNGCITDRDQDYDIMNTAPNPSDATLPATSASTLFPAEQYDYCPTSLMGLSYNWTALNQKIDAMFPNGNTNQAIGLQWGWMSLTEGVPLSAPPQDKNYQYQNVIILLTDGLNTENRWSTSESAIDARQQKICDNIKAAKIAIYTIQVNTGYDPQSSVLKYCASDSSKYFYLTSSSQISGVFNTIGTNLSQLRIAK